MSKDKLFFKSFSKLNPKYHTPTIAIMASGAGAIFLLLFNLTDLISFVAFGGLAFNTLIFASVFIFRKEIQRWNVLTKVWAIS